MEKNNAVCSICGKEYYACLSCSDAMKLHPFKSFTDTAEHFKIFQAVKGFSTGVYTKEEFKSKLQNIDLSDLESYREHIKKIIKDVLEEDKIKAVEAMENTDVNNVKEIVVEEAEIVDDVVKPTVFRKRNYKMEVE